MSVLNDNNANLIKNFNLEFNNIYFYVIKRLNRYHKCSIRIPIYNNNEWIPKYTLAIQECKNNTFLDNRKCEKLCGFKENSLENTKYNILVSMIDIDTNRVLYYYVFRNRNELFEKYINLMREALELRKQQYNIDYMGGN